MQQTQINTILTNFGTKHSEILRNRNILLPYILQNISAYSKYNSTQQKSVLVISCLHNI